MGLRLCCVRIIRGVEVVSSGVERCRAVSSGVERCRGVSRCRVWHLDTDEHGPSLDGVEGCRGVSWHGVSRCRVGVEVWCRGVEARAQEIGRGYAQADARRLRVALGCSLLESRVVLISTAGHGRALCAKSFPRAPASVMAFFHTLLVKRDKGKE